MVPYQFHTSGYATVLSSFIWWHLIITYDSLVASISAYSTSSAHAFTFSQYTSIRLLCIQYASTIAYTHTHILPYKDHATNHKIMRFQNTTSTEEYRERESILLHILLCKRIQRRIIKFEWLTQTSCETQQCSSWLVPRWAVLHQLLANTHLTYKVVV